MKSNLSVFLPLLYHDISVVIQDLDHQEYENWPYVISKGTFESQIRFLRKSEFESVTSADILRFVRGKKMLPPKAVLITFDDGYLSNYTSAVPVLEKYGYNGVFFITTNWVGRPNRLSWKQLEAMSRKGMEIGSHTANHFTPTLLTTEELRRELIESKAILESRLAAPVRALASPTGFHDPRMKSLAAESGYDIVCVGITSLFRPALHRLNPFEVNRIDIKSGISLKTFEGLVEGRELLIHWVRSKEYLLGQMKRLMGPKRYNNIRKLLLAYFLGHK